MSADSSSVGLVDSRRSSRVLEIRESTIARVEIGFTAGNNVDDDWYWFNWIEPERSFALGWHRDNDHPELGPTHVQINQSDSIVARKPVKPIEGHPGAMFHGRLEQPLGRSERSSGTVTKPLGLGSNATVSLNLICFRRVSVRKHGVPVFAHLLCPPTEFGVDEVVVERCLECVRPCWMSHLGNQLYSEHDTARPDDTSVWDRIRTTRRRARCAARDFSRSNPLLLLHCNCSLRSQFCSVRGTGFEPADPTGQRPKRCAVGQAATRAHPRFCRFE